jgi:hypothetical protein
MTKGSGERPASAPDDPSASGSRLAARKYTRPNFLTLRSQFILRRIGNSAWIDAFSLERFCNHLKSALSDSLTAEGSANFKELVTQLRDNPIL